MQMFCLGTTGYHPSPNRQTACYYLPELDLVLDAGTGIFRLIPLLQANPKAHLNIVLSHAHLDHVIGLTFLLNIMAVTQLRRVTLYGQSEKLSAIREHLFSPLLFPVPPNFDYHPLIEDQGFCSFANVDMQYFPMDHPGGSLGFLLSTGGKRLAYLTDTTPRVHAGLTERLRGVDLLMHECYFDDAQVDLSLRSGHSWHSAVGEFVEQTRPKQTLLIHVNPLAELMGKCMEIPAQAESLHLRWAEDGMVIEF